MRRNLQFTLACSSEGAHLWYKYQTSQQTCVEDLQRLGRRKACEFGVLSIEIHEVHSPSKKHCAIAASQPKTVDVLLLYGPNLQPASPEPLQTEFGAAGFCCWHLVWMKGTLYFLPHSDFEGARRGFLASLISTFVVFNGSSCANPSALKLEPLDSIGTNTSDLVYTMLPNDHFIHQLQQIPVVECSNYVNKCRLYILNILGAGRWGNMRCA